MTATLTADGYTVKLEGTPEEVAKAINELTPKTIRPFPMPFRNDDWPASPQLPYPHYPNTFPTAPPNPWLPTPATFPPVTCESKSDVQL